MIYFYGTHYLKNFTAKQNDIALGIDLLFSGANRLYKMNKGIEFISRISFLFFIVGLNADPIDESKKWGNTTDKLLNRYDSTIKLGKNK